MGNKKTDIEKQLIVQEALSILSDNLHSLESQLTEEKEKRTNLPELFSEKEASEYLGCSKPHVQNERYRGRISYLRSGKLIRYRIDDLDKYLDKIRVPAWNHS